MEVEKAELEAGELSSSSSSIEHLDPAVDNPVNKEVVGDQVVEGEKFIEVISKNI